MEIWERDAWELADGVRRGDLRSTDLVDAFAERIERFARLVGRENVIAGADCGFSTGARNTYEIHPSVVWHKFAALAEGARVASRRLWRNGS